MIQRKCLFFFLVAIWKHKIVSTIQQSLAEPALLFFNLGLLELTGDVARRWRQREVGSSEVFTVPSKAQLLVELCRKLSASVVYHASHRTCFLLQCLLWTPLYPWADSCVIASGAPYLGETTLVVHLPVVTYPGTNGVLKKIRTTRIEGNLEKIALELQWPYCEIEIENRDFPDDIDFSPRHGAHTVIREISNPPWANESTRRHR